MNVIVPEYDQREVFGSKENAHDAAQRASREAWGADLRFHVVRQTDADWCYVIVRRGKDYQRIGYLAPAPSE